MNRQRLFSGVASLGLALVAMPIMSAGQQAGSQQQNASDGVTLASAESRVPLAISYAGVLKDSTGKTVTSITGVTFLLYKDQQGGAPLWLDTQNVTPDKSGRYAVQLGASGGEALPTNLFQTGEARWLAVQIAGEAEQPRVLLVAVPYAMKAADAQTLNGLPASAFVLAAPPTNGGASSSIAASATSTSSTPPPPASAVTTNGGTANTLPLFSTATDIENSAISQTGSGTTAKIGIGTTAPMATLDVKGGATVRGVLSLPATGAATATAGKTSQPESFIASVFNGSTGTVTNQTFQWKAEPANNNTANPSAVLSLLYGSGTTTPADTGLRIGPNGIIGFAPGQTFPGGSGTVTSVGFSAPSSDFTVTGSPITSAGTLGLNWTVAPSNANTANAIVKRDAFGGFSSGSIFAVAATGSGNVGISGYSDSNYGVAGQSGNGPGVYGTSTLTNGVGIFGWAQHSGDGIYGTSASGLGVYGSVKQGQGVMGESFGTTTLNGFGPDGVVGLAHNIAGYGVYAQNYDPNGIGLYAQGGRNGLYAQGSAAAIVGYSDSGWGLSGSSNSGVGVLGSSSSGPAFQADGDAQQNRTGGGWAKAMMHVNGSQAPYTITRCYNSSLSGSAASAPPCGFVLHEVGVAGNWIIDIGFRVDDRFYSVAVGYYPLPNSCNCTPIAIAEPGTDIGYGNTTILVSYGDGGTTNLNGDFDLIVF